MVDGIGWSVVVWCGFCGFVNLTCNPEEALCKTQYTYMYGLHLICMRHLKDMKVICKFTEQT